MGDQTALIRRADKDRYFGRTLFDRWAWAQERAANVYLSTRRDFAAGNPVTRLFLRFPGVGFLAGVSDARQRRQPSHGRKWRGSVSGNAVASLYKPVQAIVSFLWLFALFGSGSVALYLCLSDSLYWKSVRYDEM